MSSAGRQVFLFCRWGGSEADTRFAWNDRQSAVLAATAVKALGDCGEYDYCDQSHPNAQNDGG
jgi:hypothetical protein